MWHHGKNLAASEMPQNVFTGVFPGAKRNGSINSLIGEPSLVKGQTWLVTTLEVWLWPIGLCMPVYVKLDFLFEIVSLGINHLRTSDVLCCAIITVIIIILFQIDHFHEPGGI